jgi:hypothetical protein
MPAPRMWSAAAATIALRVSAASLFDFRMGTALQIFRLTI